MIPNIKLVDGVRVSEWQRTEFSVFIRLRRNYGIMSKKEIKAETPTSDCKESSLLQWSHITNVKSHFVRCNLR